MQYPCDMSRETVRLARTIAVAAVVVLVAGAAAAQTPSPTPAPAPPQIQPLSVAPLPWFALDVRGGFTSLGQDTTTAIALGQLAADMPGRARTAVVGLHFYPIRRGSFKLGIGAEGLRGSSSNRRLDGEGQPTGPVIRRRLEGASGQVSLNFGKGRGWSYLTIGSGPMKFDSYLDDARPSRAGTPTLNYGGGARWFFKSHLAFTVDLRLYLTKPVTATPDAVGRQRQRLVLLSGGFSLK